jgi:cytochrome c oxidase subunit 1
MMALAAFVDPGQAVMANYVPMLEHHVPRRGGGVRPGHAGAGRAGPVAAARRRALLDGAAALRFGLHASVVATAVALLAFGWSLAVVPGELPAKAYYEILFWGGGHALQFTWTLLMLVGWLVAGAGLRRARPLSPRVVLLLFAEWRWWRVRHAAGLPDARRESVEHRDLHTWGMRFGGGLAILPVALAVRAGAAAARRGRAAPGAPAARGAARSMLLFAAGGVIGSLHRRQQRQDPGALPRLHRRRDAGADGPGLPPAAAAGLARAAGRWPCCSPGCTASGSCCTSSGWCGRAATACSARWPAPSRCCAAPARSPAWA